MNTTIHSFAPEEIMAWLDGELTPDESRTVSEHVAECAECAAVVKLFQDTSRLISDCTIPDLPEHVETAVREATTRHASVPHKPLKNTRFGIRNWRVWMVSATSAVVGIALVTTLEFNAGTRATLPDYRPNQALNQPTSERGLAALAPGFAASKTEHAAPLGNLGFPDAPAIATSKMKDLAQAQRGETRTFDYAQVTPAPQAPMIARTASLTIQIRDFAGARNALDSILAKHHGYSASLTVDTPENGQRHFQASLRIPAAELESGLADLKALGRTLNETQGGEEVTQQHADLVARLQNSRETEVRLRAILQQRTGKIEDVLQVEEEIARVRGEIESMEGEQKALEHRVAFAGVDLQLVEEYQEHFASSPISTSGRLRNAFIEGLQNASGTVIGVLIFLEECGPAILIWCAILGVPVYFVWRRYRRVRAMF
jgi:anti-sigma factor RsiW